MSGYGNIYLANRKPVWPYNVVYTPYLVLRDAWQVCKYVNLNKFQVTVQNLDRVDPSTSDARSHNHPYDVAITLMGSPIFFQETHLYTEQARDQIRPVLAVYKKYRKEMFEGYVFAIGDKPDNQSWSGFQCHIAEKKAGYLTIFRELHNQLPVTNMQLKFVAGKTIKLTNLQNKKASTVEVGEDGNVTFRIGKSPDFRFYRYEVQPTE